MMRRDPQAVLASPQACGLPTKSSMISSRLISVGRALRRSRSLFTALLVIVGGTCRDATGPELLPPGGPENPVLAISPGNAALQVGTSVTLTVDFNGNKPATWVSSDTTVATVVSLTNRTARVSGRLPGAATITATAGPHVNSTIITVVPIPVASVTLAPDSASVQRLDTLQFVATARDANGNVLVGRPVTWLSTDTTIASVSSIGRAAARTRGTASIIATVEGRADTARLVVRQAQLTVSSISAPDSVWSGDAFWLRYSVQNLWDAPSADSVIVRIGYRDSTGTVIRALRRALPRVAGGATIQDSAVITMSSSGPGRVVSVVAYVDCRDGTGGTDSTYLTACLASPASAGSIAEGDETDNMRSATVQVRLPNLMIIAVPPSSSPDTIYTRGSVTRQYVLHNQGSAAESGFEYIVGLRDMTTQSFVTAVGLTYSGLLGTRQADTVAVTLNIPALDLSHVYQFWAATDCPSQGNPAARLNECFNQPGSGSVVPELNELDNHDVYAPFVVASNIARIVAPDSILLSAVGDTTRLTPIAYDRADVPVTDASFTFESLDPGIVSATAGLLRANAAGVARVVSRSEGRADTSRVYVVSNPVPVVTSVTPASAQVVAAPPLITITGSGFLAVSVIRVNGTDRPTEFVSATELRTQATDADVAAPGSFTIVVFNPAPDGGTSTTRWVPIVSPTPVITSVSPPSIPVNSGNTVLTVLGTGFIPQARATVDGWNAEVTFVSTTELRVTAPAHRLGYPHMAPIMIINPDPAQIPDNISNDFPLEVRGTPPVITSISPSQALAGTTVLNVRVAGSGFYLNSTVRFNGVDLPTTLVNANTLDVVLSEADLSAAGTFPITVMTDGPGGGSSNALDLVITNADLQIEILSSTGAHTGGSGFALTVHGTGFTPGAQVLWNGSPRPSQYVSSTRIVGEISAADVATPSTAQLSVANPGGQTTTALTMTVRTAGYATATSTSRMTLHARDLVWDEATGRIHVSVPESAPAHGNHIVAIEPVTAATTASVFVGSNPTRLARSEDGQFLYVGLDGANAVRRVALASLTPGLQWSLRTGEVAGQIRVLPGMPGSVAVSGHNLGISPSFIGVTIFDNATPRPQISASHTGGSRIEFLESASALYGYNNQHTGFEFFTIGVDALGARHLNATSNLISGFSTNIAGGAGRIYGSDGSVVDAELQIRMGGLAGSGSAVLVEPTTGRAYMLTTSGITVYDINTFQSLGTVGVSGVVFGDVGKFGGQRLVRWGSDGIAFLDDDELFIVRSPIFAP